MNLEEFNEIFQEKCKKSNIKFDKNKSEQLYHYMKLVLEWNEKVNLTAIKDETQFIVKHYVDSLSVNYVVKGANRVLDIGAGAGFPGIPLKIYNPEVQFTLIDSVNKKIMVINEAIQSMNFKKIKGLHIRAEDLAQNLDYREKFDVVTTRAVSHMATISEYMLPFLRIGGKAVCMKGSDIEQELKESEKVIKLLGGELERIDKISIDDEFQRSIIIIKKVRKTEKKYPRGQGKPAKEPIK